MEKEKDVVNDKNKSIVDQVVFKNFVITAHMGKNNFLYYTISKRFYCKDGLINQRISVTADEVGDLLSNFRKLVIAPSVSIKKYNDKNNDLYNK